MPRQDANTPSRSTPRGNRGCLARLGLWFILLVVVPVGALVGLEFALRAAGVGTANSFFVARNIDGHRFSLTNRAFYQQFFANPIGKHWEGSEWAITREKAENELRVFIFGGSAAQGWPDPAYSFWRILQVMLEEAYPDADVRLYSAAHPGVNSHVMRQAAVACAAYEPDLFVVYLGNNEANGPFGAVYLDEDSTPEDVIKRVRLHLFFSGLRLLQLMHPTETSALYVDNVRQQFLAQGDPRLAVMSATFEDNLRATCAAGSEAGATVVLSTVGVNLRSCLPHTSLHIPPLTSTEITRWEAAFDEGKAAEDTQDWATALAAYQKAAAIGANHAELQFRLGNAYYALKDFARARDSYEMACDLDAFRSRAFRAMNEPIRKVAENTPHLAFMDGKGALAEASPHGVPGAEFFVDNCHLTFEGNYVLARATYAAAIPALEARFGAPRIQAVPSEAECRKLLALSPAIEKEQLRIVLNMAEQWNWRVDTRIEQRRNALEEATSGDWLADSAAAYATALETRPGDSYLHERYADCLLKQGRTEQALAEARRAVEQQPFSRSVLRLLARCQLDKGDSASAEGTLNRALRIEPNDAEAMALLGKVSETQGDVDAAADWLGKALAADPAQPEAWVALANLYTRAGDFKKAMETLVSAIEFAPRAFEVFDALEILLREHVPAETRVAIWRKVVDENPEAVRASFVLAMARVSAGDPEAALADYARAAEHMPNDPAVSFNWAQALVQLNRLDEAHARLDEALRANPHLAGAHTLLVEVLEKLGLPAEATAAREHAMALGYAVP